MNARHTRLFPRTFAAARSRAAARSAAGRAPRRRARKRSAACRDTGIRVPGRRTPEPWTDLERAVAALESEAVRRALSGVAVPVFHQGRECGSTVKHSDQLLMFLLKTLKPSRYACGKDSAPVAPAAPEKLFALEVDLSAAGDAPVSEEPGGGEGEDGDEDAGQREAEEAAKGDGRDASTQGAAKGAPRVRQGGRLAQARGRAGRLTCPTPERPSESAGGRSPKARPLAGQVRAGGVPGRAAARGQPCPSGANAGRTAKVGGSMAKPSACERFGLPGASRARQSWHRVPSEGSKKRSVRLMDRPQAAQRCLIMRPPGLGCSACAVHALRVPVSLFLSADHSFT
ncbi:MAG: hypothetical protein AB7E46_15065 [Desulfovibrio sp.]